MTGRQKALENVPVRKNRGWKTLSCLLAAAVTAAGLPAFSAAAADFGWEEEDGKRYWYENGIRQGTEGRGKEIYDPDSDAWYWLDAIQGGAMTRNKDIYQESPAGEWGDTGNAGGERTGKWVRYDENGHMVKGWSKNDSGTYYFDLTYGTMAKGTVQIEGSWYTFDSVTGMLTPEPEKGPLGTVEEGENVKYSGTWYGLDWKITDWGKLIVNGRLTEQVEDWQNAPRKVYDEETRTAYMDFTGATSLFLLFYPKKGSHIEEIDLHNFDTSNVTNMSNMFYKCNNLTSLDLSNFNTGNVTDMGGMFSSCNALTSLNLGSFDTGNVTSMSGMFSGCYSLTSLDLSNFDTGNVTDMSWMFSGCSRLASLDLSSFDTGNVTSMSRMFASCSSLTSLDLRNFDTGSVTDMEYMFAVCEGLTSLDLSSFDTSNVTSLYGMFHVCRALPSLDLRSFDTSRARDMSIMFAHCNSLTAIYVGPGWQEAPSNRDMFKDCGVDHVIVIE